MPDHKNMNEITKSTAWYESTLWLIFWCLLFWPVGVYGLYKRGLLPHAFGLLVIISVFTSLFGGQGAVESEKEVHNAPSPNLVSTADSVENQSLSDEVTYTGDLVDLIHSNYSLHDMYDDNHSYDLSFSNGWLVLTSVEYGSNEQGQLERFSSPNSTCIGFEKSDAVGAMMSKRVSNPIKQKLFCVAEVDFTATAYGTAGGQYEVAFSKGDLFFKSYANAFIQSPNYFKLTNKD